MRSLLALLRLPPRCWRVLGEIAGICLVVEAGLRLVPVTRLTAWLTRPARPGAVPAADPEIFRLAQAMFRRYPLGMTCLKRSLVLLALLHRRGIPADLKIGLAKTSGLLQAHAWLESERRVLWDDPAVESRFSATLPLVQAR